MRSMRVKAARAASRGNSYPRALKSELIYERQ